MSADDRVLGLAADISDRRTVDWSVVQASGNDDERTTVEELRAFAALLADDGTLKYRSGPDDLAPGSTWGPLEIRGKVGHGQFGTVYRARDPRLDRDVALKLLTWLPVHPLPSSSAIAEARLLARVRHPNVLTVHGAESIEGQIGIWSEFIEGRTLEEMVRDDGPMSAAEVTAIGLDLCRALSAVHKAGLLHRDIKAQNVMREAGGRIVLMDFGTGHDPREVPARPGDLCGTPLYVAPEIFAGGPASVASDIYALAVVLFLLLTGKYPVSGASVADVTNSHLKGLRRRIPDLKADVPAQLVEVIERGLAVDPAQRFSDSQSFERALSDVQRIVDPDTAPRLRHWKLIAAALAIGAVAIMATTLWFRRRPSDSGPLAEIQQLTFDGYARLPVISPDGTQIAYYRAWEPGPGIWLRDAQTGSETRVFAQEGEFFVAGLTFTPDGREVDFVGPGPLREKWLSLWRIPVSGGRANRVTTNVRSAVGWSPDGHRMAFIRTQSSESGHSESSVVLANRDGSNEQVLITRYEPQYFVSVGWTQRPSSRPAWSPDGRTIAVVTLDLSPDAHSAIALIDVATGREIRDLIRLDQESLRQPRILETVWLDDEHLLFSRDEPDRRDGYQIWLLDLRRHVSRQVTRDPASYVGVALTANRQVAVSERGSKHGGIWLGSSSGEHMSPVVPSSNASPTLGSVNNRGEVVYTSNSLGMPAIWLVRAGQSESVRVTFGGSPSFFPGGDALVFAKDGKQAGLYRVNVDGSGQAQLVKGLATRPQVTPDGAYLLFRANWSGPQSLWLVPVAGGTPRQLIDRQVDDWRLSAEGHQLLASVPNGVTISCELPECAEQKELRGGADPTVDLRKYGHLEVVNQGIVFTNQQDVWFRPLEGGRARQITHFTELIAGSFSISPDGRWLAVTRTIKTSDAVLLKNFR